MVLRGPSLKPLPGLYRRRATPPVQLADTFERPNTFIYEHLHLLDPPPRHAGVQVERAIAYGIRPPPGPMPLPTLRLCSTAESGPWCAPVPDLPARCPDHHPAIG